MSDAEHTDNQPHSPEETHDETPEQTYEEYEPAPEDFEPDVDTEIHTAPDHSVLVSVPGEGEVPAKVLSEGKLDRIRDKSDDQSGVGHEQIIRVLKDHYDNGRFEDLTLRKYNQSPAGYYMKFFDALMVDSPEDYREIPEGFEDDVETPYKTVPDYPVKVSVRGVGELPAHLVTQERFNELLDGAQQMQSMSEFNDQLVDLLPEHYPGRFEDLTEEKKKKALPDQFDKYVNAIIPEGSGLGN